jgi:ATP-dependent DNA helicase RecG
VDIANVFFRAGQIEAWGRGVERILAACREARFPEPVIEQEPTGLWISFPFPPEVVQRTGTTETPDETRGKMSGKMSGKIEQQIIELMIAQPQITIPEMALRLSRTERTIERNIAALRQAELVARIGPAKGGHWKILEQ